MAYPRVYRFYVSLFLGLDKYRNEDSIWVGVSGVSKENISVQLDVNFVFIERWQHHSTYLRILR